ncbi:MAG: bacteriocin immunity protein [Phycisphaerales bacterium]
MNENINARLGFDARNPPDELTRNQMKNLIDLVLDHEAYSERDGDRLVHLFSSVCKHPAGSDVIYWPKLAGFDRDLTPDEMLKVAMGEPLG